MIELNLQTKSPEQEAIKSYLLENASEILADKINNGVHITVDGKPLTNKKDLDGFMKYAGEEAKIVFAPAIDINPINKHITKNKDFNDNDLVFIF